MTEARRRKRCETHQGYRGIGKPRHACEQCWQIYFGLNEACINCGCQQNEVDEDDSDDAGRANG